MVRPRDERSGNLEFRRKNLRDLRKKKLRLTQEDFHIVIKYDKDTISRWERGEMDLTDDNLVQIIDNLNPDKIAQRLKKINCDISTKGIDKISSDDKRFPQIIEKLRPDKTIVQILEKLSLDINYFDEETTQYHEESGINKNHFKELESDEKLSLSSIHDHLEEDSSKKVQTTNIRMNNDVNARLVMIKHSSEDKPMQISSKFNSLFSRTKDQPYDQIFAHFPWNEDKGENWETPFSKLAIIAKPDIWNFTNKKFQIEGQKYPILRNYLNYTFLRLQQEDKISFSSDGKRACFNTGLQTPTEKEIYATFYKNKCSQEQKKPAWTLYAFVDSYSSDLKDFTPLPKIAKFIIDASDLVFDLSYNFEINIEHIISENGDRFPKIFHENERLAMTAIQLATEISKEKIRRNFKLAIPLWYHDKIQLLLPLNLLHSDGAADLALVADKDESRKIYRIKTAMTMDMAYVNARLIGKPDRDWLNP